MRRVLLICLLLATPVAAQDGPGFFDRLFGTDDAASDDAQGSLLEQLIEDQLSDAGRTVKVTGFSGALSGRATLQSLVISDSEGPWLTLNDAVLDWNRTALFRGALQVTEITAAEILLPRLAAPPENTAPTPEASGFALPELPVSIEIGQIAAAKVLIGAPVFGVEAQVSVDGSLSLSGGEGAAKLSIERLDGRGSIALDAAYANASETLRLDLGITEDAGGIFATLTGLPGAPSVDFGIKGDAPLSEFVADIRLATNGAERLSGQVALSDAEDARRITTQIGGDIAPVFAPEFEPFFGDAIALNAEALLYADGRVSVPGFALTARELALKGMLEVGADRLPQKIDVTGEIAPETGDSVLLPVGGVTTRLTRADLKIAFDASQSEDWTADIAVTGLERPDITAGTVRLSGTGRIRSEPITSVTAALTFEATELGLADPGLSQAVGPEARGSADIDWQGGPVTIRNLDVNGRALRASGSADITVPEAGPTIDGNLRLNAARLADFSTLAGRDLSGSAELETDFTVNLLSRAFDARARGQTRDVTLGDPRADAILAGLSELDVTATRSETGLRVLLRKLESEAARLTGAVDLRSGGSTLTLDADVTDTSVLLPKLSGPAKLTLTGQEDLNRDWTSYASLTGPGFSARLEGKVRNIYDDPSFTGNVTADAADLSAFSELVGRPLTGRIALSADGGVNADLSRITAIAKVDGAGLSIGMAQIDALLAGPLALQVDAARDGSHVDIKNFDLSTGMISAVVTGTVDSEDAALEVTARLADLAPFVQGLAGPASIDGSVGRTGDTLELDLDLTGPGGSRATIDGSVQKFTTTPGFDGTVDAEADDLSVFSGIASRPLTGQMSVKAAGNVMADLSDFDLVADVNGAGLSIGQAEADQLLAGPLTLKLDAARDGKLVDIREFDLSTGLLTANASGALGQTEGMLNLNARLADLAPFVAGFNGPLTVSGSAGRSATGLVVDLDATGPGGARANVAGTMAEDAGNADLAIIGAAPLGLANRFITPRSIAGTADFDLQLSGALALRSLSGRITTAGARLTAPTLGAALNDIAATVSLGGGSADLDIRGAVEGGGRIAVSGPLAMAAPFQTNLGIQLVGVVLSDPRLFETRVDGRIGIDGNLTGGARISGGLNLGETNIRIPNTGLGGAGEIPQITHLNEPPPVRGTRRRAGLLDAAKNASGDNSGPAYPLDISLSAPNRIFVRGRGLESEFGGVLRLTGTTANIVPLGAFELIRGRLDILGRRLALDEARITMQGSFVPYLRIVASTDAEEYRVNVNVEGPADNPDLTFTSTPELPQEEVLARLIFGRGLETLSPLQAARLALAVRTLAGQGGEGIVGRIRGSSGLADLDVTTTEDGNAAVRAGAYLGENIYTDVTVGSGGETELNLNLDITPSLTARGGVTNDGDTSVGIFFERDY